MCGLFCMCVLYEWCECALYVSGVRVLGVYNYTV